jgi:hypothetical protein
VDGCWVIAGIYSNYSSNLASNGMSELSRFLVGGAGGGGGGGGYGWPWQFVVHPLVIRLKGLERPTERSARIVF